MKSIVKTILGLVAALLLVACATSQPQPARQGFHLADGYMQAVERNARNKGIDVVWINAPSRSLAKQDEPEDD